MGVALQFARDWPTIGAHRRRISRFDALKPLALLVSLSLILTGCGPADATSSTTTLRISNWLNAAVDPAFLALNRQFEAEFEAAHVGVKLRVEPIPGLGQYAPKIILMHVAGSPPDAGYLDLSSGAIFMNNHVVRDLTPLAATDSDFDSQDYFPNVLASFQRGQQLFGVPLDFTPMVIYYNKKLFDVAGVPYPKDGWTWGDFLATAAKLIIADRDGDGLTEQFALNFDNELPFWIVWLWSNGGDVLNEDGRRASGAIDSPASLEAIEFLLSLMFDRGFVPTQRQSDAIGVDLFRAGRAAMDLKGHWMMLDYRAAGMDVGVVSVPTNIGRPVTVLYQSGLCAFAKGREPQMAWKYIRYLTSEHVQKRRVASGIAISANRQAAAHYASDPVEAAFLRQVEFGRAPWGARVERFPLMEQLGKEMMRTLMNRAGRAADGGASQAVSAEAATKSRRTMTREVVRESATLMDAALRN